LINKFCLIFNFKNAFFYKKKGIFFVGIYFDKSKKYSPPKSFDLKKISSKYIDGILYIFISQKTK
jgi:hypothetical protein